MIHHIIRDQQKMFNFIKEYINAMADKKFSKTKRAQYFFVEELETEEYFKFSYYEEYVVNGKIEADSIKFPENLHEFILEYYMEYIDFSLLLNLFEKEFGSLNLKKVFYKVDNIGMLKIFNTNQSFSLGEVAASWQDEDEYGEVYDEDTSYSFYTTKEGFLYEDYPDSHSLIKDAEHLTNGSVNSFRKINK